MTLYHYTECGLRNVWLANGYKIRKTPYGQAVYIEDVPGLHKAIGLRLVNTKPRLSGGEFRFLRKELDLAQARVAALFGCSPQTVALWEKKSPPKWADRWMRLLYQEYIFGNAKIVGFIDKLNEMDRANNKKMIFEDSNNGWKQKAA